MAEGGYIRKEEHEVFADLMKSENRRLEEENNRQNKRIAALEETVRQIGALTSSVERLATNMENMLKSIDAQGKRLEALESRDGEMWRKVVGYVTTALIGGVIGFALKQIGM